MFVQVNGARIFFDTAGSQLAIDGAQMKPRSAFLVLHGGPGFDHSTLRPYFDRFADTHQVIYIDHRGNGRSSGDEASWSLAQWGDDIKALCDALGIEKPVVLGQSFGGFVAMSYATRHPDHPAKLILSSTAAKIRLDETFAIMEARGGKEAREVAERFWRAQEPQAIADYMRVCLPLYNPPRPQSAEQALVTQRAIMKLEVGRHFALGEMPAMNFLPELANIRCPTLVLAGDYDPITPTSCAMEMHAALPEKLRRLEIFAGAGHGVHRDQPERAETILRGFLAG
jgi:pimeloyl-ACP methyl ester carboxylesterase